MTIDPLPLIEDRSAAFRAAFETADLTLPVPTCPGWTLLDLVTHIGNGQRKWAAIVAGAKPSDVDPVEPGADPAVWWDESTGELLGALRTYGPDRECWTWWDRSASPQTSGAVARHRLQEIVVHTYDAQIAQGAAPPLPPVIALDGVEEFLQTCVATDIAWPHQPATLDFNAIEGHSWRLTLDGSGARPTPDPAGPATALSRGTASDLVLWFYNRIGLDDLDLRGDRRVFEQLRDWEPEH